MESDLQYSTRLSNLNQIDNSIFQTTKLESHISQENIEIRIETENQFLLDTAFTKYPIKQTKTILPVYSMSNISKGIYLFIQKPVRQLVLIMRALQGKI